MRCGDKISLLDDDFVDSLKVREIDGLISKPAAPFHVGQHVRVTGGPFDGLVAQIIELGEKDRLVLLMGLLNGTVKVRVDAKGVTEI